MSSRLKHLTIYLEFQVTKKKNFIFSQVESQLHSSWIHMTYLQNQTSFKMGQSYLILTLANQWEIYFSKKKDKIQSLLELLVWVNYLMTYLSLIKHSSNKQAVEAVLTCSKICIIQHLLLLSQLRVQVLIHLDLHQEVDSILLELEWVVRLKIHLEWEEEWVVELVAALVVDQVWVE